MSRINFGYLNLGKDFDFFGDDIRLLQKNMDYLNSQSKTDFRTKIGVYMPSLAYATPALNISLEGDYVDLEKNLLNVIEQQGLPKFVALPESRLGVPFIDHLLAKHLPSKDTPTTYDAYELIKGIYQREKVEVNLLDHYLEKVH